MLRKNDLKLIGAFINTKNTKAELSFAITQSNRICATDTMKLIQFNVRGLQGGGLIHKQLLKGMETILKRDEVLFFEDDYFCTDSVKLRIDTGHYVEDENGKHKIGAKWQDYPMIDTTLNTRLPYHFMLESINDLQFELAQKDCYIDDVLLNPVISYSDCKFYDVYYQPQRVVAENKVETATVKIVAKKADENGVVYTQFIAVFMGRVFESKAVEDAEEMEVFKHIQQKDLTLDELYEDAKKIVIEDKKTSISYLQRKLRIGYNRTARLVEQLEAGGVVSKPNIKGNREVLL